MAKYRHGMRQAGKRSPEPSELERCLRGISYRAWWRDVGQPAMANYFHHVGHREAAEAYARRYFAQHGRLPSGEHHVVIAAKPGHGPGFEADITYPR